MYHRSRILILLTTTFLAGLTLVAPPATAAEPVVMTLTATPSTVQEGGSVLATATLRTGSGDVVPTGQVAFQTSPYCEGPVAPVRPDGTATATVTMPQAGRVTFDAKYLPGTGYEATSATVTLDVEFIEAPSELTIGTLGSSSNTVFVYADAAGDDHFECSPEDTPLSGQITFFEGTEVLGSVYSSDGMLGTPLEDGTHQIRAVFAPSTLFGEGLWTPASSTAIVTVSGRTAQVSEQLTQNPSFEAGTTGWAGVDAAVVTQQRGKSPDGAAVVKVNRTSGAVFGITDTAAGLSSTVLATTSGAVYVTSGWVAAATSSSVGRPVSIVLTERAPDGRVVREQRARTSLSNTFKRLRVAAEAVGEGHSIGMRVEQADGAAGDAFFADALTLAEASHVDGASRGFIPYSTQWQPLVANTKYVSSKQVTERLDVTTVVAYLDGHGGRSGRQAIRGVIYADAGGVPGARVATTRQITVSAGADLSRVELPFALPVPLSPGAYWIGLHSGPTSNVARYLSESFGDSRYNADAYTDDASKSFGAAKAAGSEVMLYLEGAVAP
jgi:hypothetical protein